MYIGLDEYPPYSGAISDIFETNINAHIQCDHGFFNSTIKSKMLAWINKETWEMTKNYFPDAKQLNKYPKTIVCKKYTFVQNYITQSNDIFIYPRY